MATGKLSVRFRISIPKAIRTARGWRAAQVCAVIPKGDEMLLVLVLEELAGLARGAAPNGVRPFEVRIDQSIFRLAGNMRWTFHIVMARLVRATRTSTCRDRWPGEAGP